MIEVEGEVEVEQNRKKRIITDEKEINSFKMNLLGPVKRGAETTTL